MLPDFFILMKSELSLTIIIIILLISKITETFKENSTLLNFTNILLLVNLAVGFFGNEDGALFSEMFWTNPLIVLEKNTLSFGTLIVSLLSYDWLKTHKHIAEFYMLLLSSLLGMFLMISSGNILMFYLALELSTIPLAALANFDLEKPKSSEAAMKMILSSAFSSGILLFGISFLYGTTGTLIFSEMPQHLNGSNLQMLSFVFIFTGFAFKISAVPFHFWTADVYEGSPVAVTAFLSVISKGAIVFVFVSVLYTVFQSMAASWYQVLIFTSALTMTVGNLFAIRQNNLKRFLAFSSITQAGYILFGISSGSISGTASAVYFILIYIFSNLGAFSVVSLISAKLGKENMDDYKGLYHSHPMLALLLALSLFSLAGIPPTAGFFGKIFLLTAGASKGNYFILVIAGLNLVVALYYYLKVVKMMFVDENETPLPKTEASISAKIAMVICAIGIISIGFISGLFEYIYSLSFGM